MGQSNKSCSSAKNEKAYFTYNRKTMMKHFSNSQVFLENSSEWVVIFKEEMNKYSGLSWSKPIFSVIKSWESYHDSSSRAMFVWNQYKLTQNIHFIDHSRACIWPQSIANLQTFTYEIEADPQKKILNSFIQHKTDCTIFKLIQKFKSSFSHYYCEDLEGDFKLRARYLENIQEVIDQVDAVVLDFIEIIIKILPKFFIEFPVGSKDIEEIVRNAVVSDDLLKLIVVLRKHQDKENKRKYLKGLEELDNNMQGSPMLERLEKDRNKYYLKAVGSLADIPRRNSIGEIHDAVAMLMNYISMGLYDENKVHNYLEEDEIIQAFLVIIVKSAVPELPLYIDILNRFLDTNTLNIKSVGQGIMKLAYIIDNSAEWGSFLSTL